MPIACRSHRNFHGRSAHPPTHSTLPHPLGAYPPSHPSIHPQSYVFSPFHSSPPAFTQAFAHACAPIHIHFVHSLFPYPPILSYAYSHPSAHLYSHSLVHFKCNHNAITHASMTLHPSILLTPPTLTNLPLSPLDPPIHPSPYLC